MVSNSFSYYFSGGIRSYDRSTSDRGSWFERTNSSSGGPGQPGEDGGSGTAPNGNISPRKGYTRAPFDDWRKPTATTAPPGGNVEEPEEPAVGGGGPGVGPGGSGGAGGGWRTGPSSSGRR